MLRQLLEKLRQRKAMASQMENEQRAAESISSRRKTANERELERFMEEERQKQITAQLENIRKAKRQEAWSGGQNILKEKNVFLGHKSILTDNPKLNAFGQSSQLSQGGMFLR